MHAAAGHQPCDDRLSFIRKGGADAGVRSGHFEASLNQRLLSAAVPDCLADVQFSRGFLLSNPFLLMMKDGVVMISRTLATRDAGYAPGQVFTAERTRISSMSLIPAIAEARPARYTAMSLLQAAARCRSAS